MEDPIQGTSFCYCLHRQMPAVLRLTSHGLFPTLPWSNLSFLYWFGPPVPFQMGTCFAFAVKTCTRWQMTGGIRRLSAVRQLPFIRSFTCFSSRIQEVGFLFSDRGVCFHPSSVKSLYCQASALPPQRLFKLNSLPAGRSLTCLLKASTSVFMF